MTDEISQKNPGHFKILALYTGLLVSVVFQFPLNTMLPVISFFMLLTIFAFIGFLRKEADKDSYMYHHATFLSRTLWMSSFMLLVCVAIAGIYINDAVTIGLEEIQTLSQDMREGSMDSPLIKQLLPVTGAAIAPSMVYFLWRYSVGFFGAVTSRSPKRPRSFF